MKFRFCEDIVFWFVVGRGEKVAEGENRGNNMVV